MPFRLKRSETVAAGVRRAAREQIDRALDELRTMRPNPDEAVHAARKRFKKLRGLLRLVRPCLGGAYDRENVRFRDLGRKLATARETAAMVETLDKLVDAHPDGLPWRAFAGVRRRLVKRREAAGVPSGGPPPRVRGAIVILRGARAHVGRWRLNERDFAAIEGGLTRTYRQARRAMHLAADQPSAEHFHEWRKQVKYHWYHVRLLQGLRPRVMRARRRALRDLSELLGDDHDLAVLAALVRADREHFGLPDEVRALLDLIELRQAELEDAAFRLGKTLFEESPRKFARRMRVWWARWRAHGRPSAAGES